MSENQDHFESPLSLSGFDIYTTESIKLVELHLPQMVKHQSERGKAVAIMNEHSSWEQSALIPTGCATIYSYRGQRGYRIKQIQAKIRLNKTSPVSFRHDFAKSSVC